MRCESCAKFVSLETQDPEVDRLEMNGEDLVAEVRIVRCCADCGSEMKEAALVAEAPCPLEDCDCGDDQDLELDGEDTVELVEEGGGRYKKSYYGFQMTASVKCLKCGASASVQLSEKAAASEFEEIS